MNHTRKPGLCAGFDGHTGTGNGRRGGDAAKQGRENVSHALGNQFPVTVETHTGHTGGAGAAQKAFNHTQGRNTDSGSQQTAHRSQIQPFQSKALRQQQTGGNLPHPLDIHGDNQRRRRSQNDGNQRSRYHRIPLLGVDDHKHNNRAAQQHRRHGAGGAGNLIVGAAQQADDKAADDGGQQARRRRGAAADTEGQGQRQGHRRHRHTGHQVLGEFRAVIAAKLLPQIGNIGIFHLYRSFLFSQFVCRCRAANLFIISQFCRCVNRGCRSFP